MRAGFVDAILHQQGFAQARFGEHAIGVVLVRGQPEDFDGLAGGVAPRRRIVHPHKDRGQFEQHHAPLRDRWGRAPGD